MCQGTRECFSRYNEAHLQPQYLGGVSNMRAMRLRPAWTTAGIHSKACGVGGVFSIRMTQNSALA